MIKYLGSKRVLLARILDLVERCPGTRTVLDLFSGTSRVGHALKRAGYRVIANDHNAYAATLARCYVQADREELRADAARLVRELNALKGRAGYFTEVFCIRSQFFQPANGERIDAIRERIAGLSLAPELEAVLLVSLMEAADRVDSTTGLQMAYLKAWAPRAFNPLELRVPDLLPRSPHGKGEAHQLEAEAAARMLVADLAYIDPPYNQHAYLGNYHIWETLVRWDKPPVFGVACKRADVRERRSPFNSRRLSAGALRAVLERVRAPVVVLSFNDEGFLSREDLAALLGDVFPGAEVTEHAHAFQRYVGARIGIYNPRGEKVGRVGRLTNHELLYVVRRRTDEPERKAACTLASAPLDQAGLGIVPRIESRMPCGEPGG